MQGVPDEIIERQLGHFEKTHPDYATEVRAVLADLAKGKICFFPHIAAMIATSIYGMGELNK